VVRARKAEATARRRRELAATALLALMATLKVPLAILLVPAVAVMVWRDPREARRRSLLAHVTVAIVVGASLAIPFVQRHDPMLGFFQLSSYASFLAPSTFFRHLLAVTFGGEGTSAVTTALSYAVRVSFGVTFVVVFAFLVRHLASQASRMTGAEEGAGWAWSLLLFTLCAPILFPWYLVWTLPLMWLLPRVPRTAVALMCAVLPLAQVVASPLRSVRLYDDMISLGIGVIAPALFLVLVRLLKDLAPRLQMVESLTGKPEGVGRE